MTNENIIEIKKQKKNWFAKGLFYLFLMLCSLYVTLMPLVSEFAEKNNGIFYVAGFSLFTVFTFMYIFNIYKTCKPENAIILSARGFIDRINVGDDVEIEWTNVSAVKTLGKANTPYLGVTLENTDIVLSKMKKKLASEMRENIEQNLPTILISQSSVKISVKDLKETFAKFAREARALERDSQQKNKNNPFSTDDVLRAFGKLPKEEPKEEIEKEPKNEFNVDSTPLETPNIELNEEINNNDNYSVDDIKDINIDIDNTSSNEVERAPEIPSVKPEIQGKIPTNLTSPFEIPDDIVVNNNEGERKRSASDSFYEALRAKTNQKNSSSVCDNSNNLSTDNSPAEASATSEDMPEEIKEILNRAKSSRISQIEEILCKNDIPYSLSREDSSKSDKHESYEESAFADESVVEDIDPSNPSENDNPVEVDDHGADDSSTDVAIDEDIVNIDISAAVERNDKKTVETPISSLDSLIETALMQPQKVSEPIEEDNLGDTKEFIM